MRAPPQLLRFTLTIGPTSYRGPERRTLKTAEKQPKKVPSGPRVKCREKQPDGQPNSRKAAVLHASGVFPAVFRLFRRHFTRGPLLFRLFFGCFQGPAFRASVAGRADRKFTPLTKTPLWKPPTSYQGKRGGQSSHKQFRTCLRKSCSYLGGWVFLGRHACRTKLPPKNF